MPGSKFLKNRRVKNNGLLKRAREAARAKKQIKAIESIVSPKPLGQLLLEAQLITEQTLDEALMKHWRTGQTVGQIFQSELSALNENFIIEVTGLPWPTFLRNQRASNLPIFFSGWLEDIHDPHNWVVPYTTGTYGGRQRMPAELKAQFADINTRAVTESDPAKRDEIYKFSSSPMGSQ